MSQTYNLIANQSNTKSEKKRQVKACGRTSIQGGGPLPDQGLAVPDGGAPPQGEAVAPLGVQIVDGAVRGLRVVHGDLHQGVVVGLHHCTRQPDKQPHKTNQSGDSDATFSASDIALMDAIITRFLY